MSRRTLPSKFIVFRTRGKIFNPQDCHLVFNSNEIGQPEDPERIYEIERIYNDGPTKSSKLLGVLFDEYLSFDAHITTKEGLFCLFGIFVPISRHTPPPPIPKLIESPLRASKHLAVSQDISGPPPPPPPYMRTQHICKTPEGRRGAMVYKFSISKVLPPSHIPTFVQTDTAELKSIILYIFLGPSVCLSSCRRQAGRDGG